MEYNVDMLKEVYYDRLKEAFRYRKCEIKFNKRDLGDYCILSVVCKLKDNNPISRNNLQQGGLKDLERILGQDADIETLKDYGKSKAVLVVGFKITPTEKFKEDIHLDNLETEEYNRSYNPDYDIPDDWEGDFEDCDSLKLRRYKGEDNFCTLVPGLPKLKRGSKKFNQNSKFIKDIKVSSNDFGTARIYGPSSIEDLKRLAGLREKVYLEQDYNGRTHGFWKAASTLYRQALKGQLKFYDNKFTDSDTYDVCFKDIHTGKQKCLKNRTINQVEHLENNKNIVILSVSPSDKKFKDWMPSKTPLDYICEKLDAEGIKYEIENDEYGAGAPYDTCITILEGDDSRADDIICSVVGYAYEWVKDKDGNRRYCKVCTDEDLINEYNETSINDKKFKDIYPNKYERKEDFISRFMKETKEEYPDYKQRLAVAYSYWNKSKGIK